MAINLQRVLAAVQQAEAEALEEVADFVVRDAKARAPIRKVFKEGRGFRRKFRPLTGAERNLAIRRALAYYGPTFKGRAVVAHIQHYARAELRRPGSANALARSRTLRVLGTERGGRFSPRVDAARVRGGGFRSASLEPLLTSRGKYEVRSGRAIHREVLASGATQVQVGGRLKASIGSEGVVQQGNKSTIQVSARVRYAKYVEFPTTHNAAQPFLLPALHDSRARLRSTLARALRNRLGG